VIGLGTVINGKYRLTRLLGDGGMGSVYEAEHTVLGTRVAIKVLHPELARRTGLVERFLQEARVAAQIRSAQVVHVTDVDRTPDGHAYLVMDLLEGEPLSSLLDRQHKLSVATACEYALQILAALEAAHALGVIHRDLKPENVFVTFVAGKPVLKLIDFGIAKARRDELPQKKLTVAGVVMGTAEYMAPEQARSADRVDGRADIYAAGVMLYEMLAGERPVAGEDARAIALKVEHGEVVPLVRAAPLVPGELAGLVHRAMAARPELRFATATDMRLALEKVRRAGTAVLASGDRTNVGAAMATAAGTRGPLSAAAGPSEDPESPPVHTMRAPPIASALGAPAYGAAPLPVAPVPLVPPADENRRPRRRGRGALIALVALPLVAAAAIVGILAAAGTWASGGTPAAPPSPRTLLDEEGAAVAPRPTPTHSSTVSDVPKLVPTRPLAAPAAQRSSPPLRASGASIEDAGPPPPPFFLPSTLPSTLPPFPSILPFPASFPSTFPSVLPAWPPAMPSSKQAPAEAPSANGPGY
jgi:serine/threonine protein kinase